MTKSLAIVGATGAVGLEMLRTLDRRNFPFGHLELFGGERSAESSIRFKGDDLPVRRLEHGDLTDFDIALFSAGSDVSKEFAPEAVAGDCIVIDNSSAFRLEKDVPLVVPEINAHALKNHKGIIANPNCTTAIILMAIWQLQIHFGIRRIIATSLQAASGAGQKGIEELRDQMANVVMEMVPPKPKVFPRQLFLNAIPQVGAFLPEGDTEEEMKLVNEGRKIMGDPSFDVSITCTRVPVMRAHAISVLAELRRSCSPEEARQAMRNMRGLVVLDENEYQTSLEAEYSDECFVGRVRKAQAFDNGISMWIVGDQLRKGAALNAVQIAEELLKL